MKKSNLLLTMLMLMCFSVGTWAADYELVYTLDGSVTTGGNSNYAQDGGGLTQDGIDWSVTGNTTINPWRIGGKNLTNEDRLAYSKTAISDNVAKIEIEHGGITLSAVNSVKVEVASNADFSTILETFTTTTVEANKTITHLRPSGQDWSGAYYRITYNVTAGSSNTYIQLKSVKFYKEKAATTEPSISIEQNGSAITAVDFGEVASYTETENEGYVVFQSVDIKASNLNGDVYLEVENSGGNYFSIYDPRYAVTSWDKFTIKPTAGAIDTTIVLKAATWMSAGTQTGKLKVSSKASTADFTALNIDLSVTVFDPAEGDYDISLNNTFFGLSATGANPDEQTGSYKGITVVAGCTSTAQNKTYYDAAHVRFYGDSYLRICAPYGFVVDAVTFTAGGTWNGGISADAGTYDADKKEWTGSSSCVTFSFTAQDRISKATVSIIKAPEVGLPTISGQTPFYPSTTVTMSIETDGADIIYTMNGEDPLGGDNTYSQPIVLTETKTIKARGFKGVNLGDVVTKTFTKATPISVADAIELIPDAGNTKNDQFVVGYVCTASESEPSNGQMTYYISDNGSTVDEGTATTDRIQIYKGKGLNNADFTAASDLAVGDKVVVYGQLKNYNGTYEFNSGNYIVEYTKKELKSVGVSGSLTQTEYDYGDQLNVAGLKATAYYTVGGDVDVTNDPSLVWTMEGSPLSEKLVYGGNSFVQASYGGKTSSAFDITTTIKTYALTISSPTNGTLVIKNGLGEEISSGDKFWKNALLTVIATPATGYKLDKIAILKASDDSDVTSELLNGKDLKMPNYAIKVSASFAKVSNGKLVITPNKINYGVVKVDGTVTYQAFTLKCSGFTKGDMIYIQAPDGFTATTTSFGINNEDGTREYGYIFIIPSSETLGKPGVYDGNVVISSDGMAADSIVPVKLTVGGVVTTTPSPVALDLGDVLNNDNPSLYGKTFHIKITNLSANKQARVVPSTASFSVEPYYITANADGVIDRDVTILPYLNGGGAAVYNADLEVICTGTREFKDIKVGTVTMNLLEAYKVIVPEISNGSLSWDGGTAPQAVRPGTTHTIAAVPASGYEGGTIQILKNSDDSDITESVMSGSTLTMPSYAIKIVVSGFKQSAKPALPMSWKYESYTLTYGVFKEPALYSSLNINDNLKSTYGDQIVITSSNTNVATYTSKYSEYQCYTVYNSIVGAGTTVFTAYFAGDDTYGETTVTYTLTVNKADAGLAWSANAATVKYGASNNVFPTLSNPNNLTVSYESAPTWNATIDSNGAITIANVGEATISAKFAGNSNYNAQTVEYTLTIEKGIPGYEYQINGSKVEDVYVTYGAKDNVFPTLVKPEDFGVNYQSTNTAVAAITSYGTIYLYKAGTTTIKACFWGTSQWEADTATFVLHVAKGTPKLEWNAQYTQIENDEVTVDIYDSADGRQLPHLNSDAPDGVVITSSNESVVKINETSKYPVLQYETGDAIVTASFAENDQYNAKSISYTVHAVDNIRYQSNLQWRIGTEQVSSASVTLAGNDNVFPTLYNPRNVTPTYSSSNEKVATISNGTITLVGAGTTTITASFDGNYSYKPSTATYTLTVNAVANISVGGVSSIDFGTVNKGASVDEQSFTLVGSNLTGNVKVTAATEGSTSVFVTNGFRPSNTYTPTDGAINASVVVIPYTSKAGDFNGTLTIESLTGDFETIEIPLHIWVKAKPTITLVAGTQVHMTVKDGETVINSGDAVEEGTVLTVEISMGSTSWKLTSLTAGTEDIMQSRQFTVGTSDITVTATSDMKLDADISWSTTAVVYAYTDGSQTTVWPTIENPHNLDVTCRANNSVVTVDNNGVVSLVEGKSGIVSIFVEFAGNNDYKPASKSYTLRVCAPDHITVSEQSIHQSSYEYGDPFVFKGFVARMYYDYSDVSRDVTSEATWTTDPATITADGTVTVSATLSGVTGSVSNVSVFVKKHTITINPADNGSIVIKHGDDEITSGDKFVKGTELTVSVTPADGYELNSITINGEVLEGNTFTVGTKAMEVVVTFKPKGGTGIDQVELEQQIRKEFRDGKLYILRGGKTYDAAGRLVK